MTVAARVPDLFKIAEAADRLEEYLEKNVGSSADWPITMLVDEDVSSDLCGRLMALREALAPYRSSVKSALTARRTLLKVASTLE